MNTAILVLVIVLMLFGLLGILLPVLPGVGLIYGAILLYAVAFGIEKIGVTTLIVLGVAAVLSIAIDYVASAYGAKRSGGSKWGSWGSVIGGLFGFLVLNIPGLIAGIFLGAVAGEMLLSKKTVEESLHIGFGSLLGFLGGTVLKLILGIAMIGVFIWRIWSV